MIQFGKVVVIIGEQQPPNCNRRDPPLFVRQIVYNFEDYDKKYHAKGRRASLESSSAESNKNAPNAIIPKKSWTDRQNNATRDTPPSYARALHESSSSSSGGHHHHGPSKQNVTSYHNHTHNQRLSEINAQLDRLSTRLESLCQVTHQGDYNSAAAAA